MILIKPIGLFHPTSKKLFMPKKFPELFIDCIILERKTVTKFFGVFIDEMSHGKLI